MIIFLLKKLFAALTIMVILSGCKKIIGIAGGFSMLNNGYINNSDEWISRNSNNDDASNLRKLENMDSTRVFSKNTHSVRNDAFSDIDNYISNNSVKLPEAYSEINKKRQKNSSKLQDWIVCKSQFIRDHSEEHSMDMHLGEILF